MKHIILTSIFFLLFSEYAFSQESCRSFFLDDTGKAPPFQNIYEKDLVEAEFAAAILDITYIRYEFDISSPTYHADVGAKLLQLYTESAYTRMNSPLRKQARIEKNHRIVYTLMTKSIETFPIENQTLYRWGRFSPEVIASFQKGKVVRFNSFLSTTKSATGYPSIPSMSEGAVNFIFVTHKSAHDISKINPFEAEVIFKPGSNFKITGVEGLKVFLEEVVPIYRPDLAL